MRLATLRNGSNGGRPIAALSDELGDDWRNGRACLNLHADWNGKRFGAANGEPKTASKQSISIAALRLGPLSRKS